MKWVGNELLYMLWHICYTCAKAYFFNRKEIIILENTTVSYRVNRKLLYFASFLIPAVLMMIVWVALGVYPFGSRSILVSDLEIQFVDYYAYFKSILSGSNDFIYTFSKNLGGDVPGFSAYYLQNPLLFLLALFSERNLPTGIMVMIVLQVSLSGLSFSYFINHVNEPKYSSLLFSTAYSFMGFFFGYIPLTIYFSNFAVLPLVLLGITRITENPKHYKLYTFSLALYVFMNYYLGFMMCIFSALYFVYLILVKSEKLCNLKSYGKNIVAYLLSSVLGILLVAFDLAMTAVSLKGQKESPDLSRFGFYRQFRMLDVFAKLFSGSDKNHELPIIYCSIFVVVCVILYFGSRQIKRREKLLTAGFLGCMLVCFYIHALDIIWHGFNDPVGFKYRYSYFFSFLMITVGYRGFSSLKEKIAWKQVLSVAGLFVIYSLYLFVTRNAYVGTKDILLNGLFVAGILAAMVWFGREKEYLRRAGWILLSLVLCVDIVSNAVRAVNVYPANEMARYTEYYDKVSPAIDYVKEGDDGFYRMEKDFYRDKNDSMLFNYAGLSHSSSCEKDYVKEFIGKMGFRNNILFAFYNRGSTVFADSFLGVKYYISRFDTTDKPYHKMTDLNDLHVFQNPYALPLGFCTNDRIDSVDMQTDNVFEIQNEIAQTFGETIPSLYEKTEPDRVELTNLAEEKNGEITQYTKINGEQDAYIEYTFTVSKRNGLYLYFNAPELQSAELFVNDASRENYFTNTNWNVVYMGKYEPGETVTVRLSCLQDSLQITNALFYYENDEALGKWYESAQEKNVSLQKKTSSHLFGTVTVPEGKENLVFSIPYEKGWKITVDGEKVSQKEVLGALMAVDLESGEHVIEMRYVPEGFFPAIWISLFAFAVLMFLLINDKIKGNDLF